MGILFSKWMLVLWLPVFFLRVNNSRLIYLSAEKKHPIHVSVTEINHNAKEQTVEVSCKIFIDDFEKVLIKNYKQAIDLVHPKDKAAMDKPVSDYITRHLSIKVNDKALALNYIGFEIENDAVFVYFEAENIALLKKADVTNTVLHDLYTDQTEIIHVVAGGNRKSVKLDYPVSTASFQF